VSKRSRLAAAQYNDEAAESRETIEIRAYLNPGGAATVRLIA
jgi:hypothetical protein